ncbi:MAG: transposase [Gemmataceae bacterium]
MPVDGYGTPLVRDTPFDRTREQQKRGQAFAGGRPKSHERHFYPPPPPPQEGHRRLTPERLAKRCPEGTGAQRESLGAIFEDTAIKDPTKGERELRGWTERALAVGLQGPAAFCKTLNNWLGKIANYSVWRSSNGRTEGFDLGLRAILWRAFGMVNFRLRLLDRFGSLALISELGGEP